MAAPAAANMQPHVGSSPPFERFSASFDPDKREMYSADDFARDAKRYIKEIASGPNWSVKLRTRTIREALRGKAKKFVDKDIPERWMEDDSSVLDLNDGRGQIGHEPYEIILFLMQSNYGPDKLTKDMKECDEFENVRMMPNARMSDTISDFESKREKAARKGFILSVPALSRKFLRMLGISPTSELWDEVLKHCADTLPTTEIEYREMLNKLKKRDGRKRVGSSVKSTRAHLVDYENDSTTAFPTWDGWHNGAAQSSLQYPSANAYPTSWNAQQAPWQGPSTAWSSPVHVDTSSFAVNHENPHWADIIGRHLHCDCHSRQSSPAP